MYSFFLLFIYFCIFTNNSHAAHINTTTNSQIKNYSVNYFSKLPSELIIKIFYSLTDLKGFNAIQCTTKCFYTIVKNNPSFKLFHIDKTIEFEYHFTEKSEGSLHEQDYYTLPLSGINVQKMLFIIDEIKKISNNTNPKKSVKQIAQELKCFQYITFHEEYCFRAMFPSEEYEWIDYTFLIFQTCKKYIGFFDPNYILEKDFLENDNTCKAFNINFPCSLLDVIITVGNNFPIMQTVRQDENFEAYVKQLFNTAENTITEIDINNFEKTDNLSEQTFMNKDSYKNRFIQFFCKKIVMFLLLIKKFFSIFFDILNCFKGA